MSDVKTTVDAYLNGLTQTDAARRAELIRTASAEDGRLVDPLFARSPTGPATPPRQPLEANHYRQTTPAAEAGTQ